MGILFMEEPVAAARLWQLKVTLTAFACGIREVSPSGGSAPICIILRGNTNIPLDMQNARDITANALAITALAQEQTGILLGTLA